MQYHKLIIYPARLTTVSENDFQINKSKHAFSIIIVLTY